MTKRDAQLHIEELVLHGFAPGDRHAIAEAVEQELSRLLTRHCAEAGTASRLALPSEVARVDAGAFQVEPRSRPSSIGTQIGQAVHGILLK
ncbi:MAG TPA: hypothetical protein VLL54_20815 [Pyrinomonadaceae bacterium]|nr:hypothetical protein [Pyrinomonadaceae bacterium]